MCSLAVFFAIDHVNAECTKNEWKIYEIRTKASLVDKESIQNVEKRGFFSLKWHEEKRQNAKNEQKIQNQRLFIVQNR